MAERDPALGRFWLMNAARLAGVACIMLGIAGSLERLDMPQALAIVLALAGMALFFVAPTLIARSGKPRR